MARPKSRLRTRSRLQTRKMSPVQKTLRKTYLIVFLLTALTVLISGITFFRSYQSPKKQDIKEKQLEMTKLPKEVKKKLGKITPSQESFKIPILIYHYVEVVTDKRDTIRQSLNILPSTFGKQIQTLKEAGYTFITPSQIGDALDGKTELPKKPVVLSFDDGYRDFYTDVLPIIQKHNVKVVAYIVPGFLDHINYMYSWQVHDLQNSGLVEIGAHTVHHVYLKGMSLQKANEEITESKKMLEQMLYTKIVSFAYPYGAFTEQVAQLVKKTGFTTAVSTVGGNEVHQYNKYFLYRIHAGSATGQSLLNVIEKTYPKPF